MLEDIIEKIKFWGFIPTLKKSPPLVKRYLKLLFLGFSSVGGEDRFVSGFFPRNYKGFYVDVGTNDPIVLNNTYYFNRKGWSGINIEPDIECFNKIMVRRPKDKNYNVGIGNRNGSLDYYSFYPSLVSTFSKSESKENIKTGYKLIKKIKVPVRRLEEILDESMSFNQKIDFMSIDTEGYDLQVLESMNIKKYKPKFICVEKSKDSISSDIDKFLRENSYSEIYFNKSNSIYSLSD